MKKNYAVMWALAIGRHHESGAASHTARNDSQKFVTLTLYGKRVILT
jgi:hypothetical protein